MLAHGALLRKNFFNVEQMRAIVKDFRNAGLSLEEVTIMAFAQNVVNHPGMVSKEDIEELHAFGLSDEEILNVVVVVTARSFFSKTLDALDIEPDEIYLELEPELIQALTIGRPFP
jgi:alkylhydroperoxidase family enzyme